MIHALARIQDCYTPKDYLSIAKTKCNNTQGKHFLAWNDERKQDVIRCQPEEHVHCISNKWLPLMILTTDFGEIQEICEYYNRIIVQCLNVGKQFDQIISDSMSIEFDCGAYLITWFLNLDQQW